ncbi:MAG: MraY family glycosyltransferase [Candidatus Margulisiibacteriota bacterium]
MHPAIIVLFSFLAAYFSTFLFRAIAVKFNILDIPNQRKIHKESTPLLGGLAVFLGVLFVLFFRIIDDRSFFVVFGAAAIILIVGLIDDMKNLSVRFRLITQIIAVSILIYFGIKVTFLPNNIFGNTGEILITFLWVIGITNAVNCLDGIDGLASGTAAIGAFFFALISYQADQIGLALISIILAVSCLGFLPHNLGKKKIFLGDAGSNFIGFMLASIALLGNWGGDNIVRLTIPVLIMAVPIFDMIFTTVMRVKEEKVTNIAEWMKYGGKDHFHHCLVDLGLKPRYAVIFVYFVAISFGLSAAMISGESALAGILSLAQACIIFAGIATLVVIGKRRRTGWNIAEKK